MHAAADNFNITQIVGVDGWQADTAVVHLTGEDLIAEEVVSEDTAVRVSEVVRVSHGYVWKVSEKSVHRVVLLFDIIEMLSVFVDSVRAEHVLEEQEGVIVLMFDTRGIVEDSDVGVVHLIITDHK